MNTRRYSLTLDARHTEALRDQARQNYRSLSAEVRKLIADQMATRAPGDDDGRGTAGIEPSQREGGAVPLQ